jgi:uncharacterized protein YjbJ (UPF0337 family)
MNKLRNKTDEISGRVRERIGKLTHNKDLERRGRLARSKSQLKQAGDNVKDAVTRPR